MASEAKRGDAEVAEEGADEENALNDMPSQIFIALSSLLI